MPSSGYATSLGGALFGDTEQGRDRFFGGVEHTLVGGENPVSAMLSRLLFVACEAWRAVAAERAPTEDSAPTGWHRVAWRGQVGAGLTQGRGRALSWAPQSLRCSPPFPTAEEAGEHECGRQCRGRRGWAVTCSPSSPVPPYGDSQPARGSPRRMGGRRGRTPASRPPSPLTPAAPSSRRHRPAASRRADPPTTASSAPARPSARRGHRRGGRSSGRRGRGRARWRRDARGPTR